MPTTLNGPSISCAHCKSTIEGAVSDLTGVTAVDVDIDARAVEIDFDPKEVSLDEIVEAIVDVSYEVVT